MSYLGIEIGGTKLQLGIGEAQTDQLDELIRTEVDTNAGAADIVRKIEQLGRTLLAKHDVARIGVGFGGPVDSRTGRVTKSHQIAGWDDVPLVERWQKHFDRPTVIDNDCNLAALAEAKLGAGRATQRVFYVTVGTGIGGGFVVNGRLHGNDRPAIAEIGHLRPGPDAHNPQATVESIASGWGIAASVRRLLRQDCNSKAAQELRSVCEGDLNSLTTEQIAQRAGQGNAIATSALEMGARTLGWAIAQMVTLLAPHIVVVGGGVSLIGEDFFAALRHETARYVFPPLADAYSIVPAELGEEVVVHGALLLAGGTS